MEDWVAVRVAEAAAGLAAEDAFEIGALDFFCWPMVGSRSQTNGNSPYPKGCILERAGSLPKHCYLVH